MKLCVLSFVTRSQEQALKEAVTGMSEMELLQAQARIGGVYQDDLIGMVGCSPVALVIQRKRSPTSANDTVSVNDRT